MYSFFIKTAKTKRMTITIKEIKDAVIVDLIKCRRTMKNIKQQYIY